MPKPPDDALLETVLSGLRKLWSQQPAHRTAQRNGKGSALVHGDRRTPAARCLDVTVYEIGGGMLFRIHVGPGEEVLDVVARRLADQGIRRGVIVSVIGAVDECRVSNMPVDDASRDVVTDYAQPFELSGTGEVDEGKPHIH